MAMNDPVSTYRIQFHQQFSFAQFRQVIPYLHALGVKTIYASPVFDSVRGSSHGYDGIDHNKINPAIGSLTELNEIIGMLQEESMGWLQDIVPNHMAFHSSNHFLMAVLQNGAGSSYAAHFDIFRDSESFDGKIMVPFLGSDLEEVIAKDELSLIVQDGFVMVKYFDSSYPLRKGSYEDDVQIHGLDKINSDHRLLRKILDKQYYRLCHSRETDYRINYRRFFTINSLICLNIQDQKVFDHHHQLVVEQVAEGFFNGLRIDHIDGLYDPATYLQVLRKAVGQKTYITVEKILQAGESLPANWETAGTTGYDFLALVNNLFTNKSAETAFTNFYSQLVDEHRSIQEQLLEKKRLILEQYMGGELDYLCGLLSQLSVEMRINVSAGELKKALAAFLIHCPVYRFYGNTTPLEKEETLAVENILGEMENRNVAVLAAIDLLRNLFLRSHVADDKILHFYKRCMQFTGPLMAKGLEDTFMYTYNRFIAHNDVGDSPAAFGISKQQFHEAMMSRLKNWPLTMNATSTHDTKRGEDARARLNVLSDLSDEWLEHAATWREIGRPLKKNNVPGPNDEYFIYQTLIANHPMAGDERSGFQTRLMDYLGKSMREAKTNTNWVNPNDEYENGVRDFIGKLLGDGDFLKDFTGFQNKIADFGIVNSLSQLLLKFICPGIPDIYQGCELWDLSFVDPDNRRPVDFEKRTEMLKEILQKEHEDNFAQWLWNERHSGYIKLWLTQQLLQLRSEHIEFFQKADYVPLETCGKYAEFVFSVARRWRQHWLVAAIPLHVAQLCRQQREGIRSIDWKDTGILLPAQSFSNVVSIGPAISIVANGNIPVSHFNELPFFCCMFVTT